MNWLKQIHNIISVLLTQYQKFIVIFFKYQDYYLKYNYIRTPLNSMYFQSLNTKRFLMKVSDFLRSILWSHKFSAFLIQVFTYTLITIILIIQLGLSTFCLWVFSGCVHWQNLPTEYVSFSLKLQRTWSIFRAWRNPLPLTTTWKLSETEAKRKSAGVIVAPSGPWKGSLKL